MIKQVEVIVRLKDGVLDPQGKTIAHALANLGVARVRSVSTGKRFVLDVDAESDEEAESVAKEAAHKLLANPVVEVAHVKAIK